MKDPLTPQHSFRIRTLNRFWGQVPQLLERLPPNLSEEIRLALWVGFDLTQTSMARVEQDLSERTS